MIKNIGSVLKITEYKRYLEWHYRKRKGIDDKVDDLPFIQNIDPKGIFNTDYKNSIGIKTVSDCSGKFI